MMLNKITRQDIEDAIDALTPAGKGATCWHKKLATTDDGTELCFVVGWSDAGYSEDDINADGFGDNNGCCICAKIAYQHSNNAMQSDYDMDWLQPYDKESGEVYDTDTMLTNEPSQWGHVAKVFNKEAQDIWDTYGETGELDLMESKQSKESCIKKEGCKSSMQKKKESLKKTEAFTDTIKVATEDIIVEITECNTYDSDGRSFSVDIPSIGMKYSLEEFKDMVQGMAEDCSGTVDYSRDGSEVVVEVNAPVEDFNSVDDYYRVAYIRGIVGVVSTSVEGVVNYLTE